MRVGVHLPVAGKAASPEIILQVAVEAERIGLDSAWSWEQLMRLRCRSRWAEPAGRS
jgi:hypothetical protein